MYKTLPQVREEMITAIRNLNKPELIKFSAVMVEHLDGVPGMMKCAAAIEEAATILALDPEC